MSPIPTEPLCQSHDMCAVHTIIRRRTTPRCVSGSITTTIIHMVPSSPNNHSLETNLIVVARIVRFNTTSRRLHTPCANPYPPCPSHTMRKGIPSGSLSHPAAATFPLHIRKYCTLCWKMTSMALSSTKAASSRRSRRLPALSVWAVRIVRIRSAMIAMPPASFGKQNNGVRFVASAER